MMRREGGRVVIEISEDQFTSLLLCLGYAAGAADSNEAKTAFLRVANAIAGIPGWMPYGGDGE